MRKTNIVRKIALGIFMVMTLVSVVALVFVCNQTYGRTYHYNLTIHGLGSVSMTCNLDDDGGEMIMKVKMGQETQNKTINFAYYVIDGNLYIYISGDEDVPEQMIEGKIDAFTLVLSQNNQTQVVDGKTQTLYCEDNINMRTAVIVVLACSASLTIGCLLSILFDKKNRASARDNKVKVNGGKVDNQWTGNRTDRIKSMPTTSVAEVDQNETPSVTGVTYKQKLIDLVQKKSALETALLELRQEAANNNE